MTHSRKSSVDLEIHISPRNEQGYPVSIKLDDGRDFGPGFLSPDILPWTPSGNAAQDGKKLFDALFAAPKLREAWGLARGAEQCRVRLWIDPSAPELHALPWEYLHDGGTWLAADAATPLSLIHI